MQQIVQVDLPIKFGECGLRQVAPREFTRTPRLEEVMVHVERVIARLALTVHESGSEIKWSLRGLFVGVGLHSILLRYEELRGYFGISRGQLVDTGSAVPKVLAGNENGHSDVELEFNHFKGRGVMMAHEVPYESLVRSYSGCSGSGVRDSSGLDDCVVEMQGRHRINQPNEPPIVHW